MTFEVGKTYKTRAGLEVTLVAALPDTIATESPLIGYFRDDGIVSTWGRDGS